MIDSIELADGRTMIVRPTSAGDAERILRCTAICRSRIGIVASSERSSRVGMVSAVGDRGRPGGFGVIAVVSPTRTSVGQGGGGG